MAMHVLTSGHLALGACSFATQFGYFSSGASDRAILPCDDVTSAIPIIEATNGGFGMSKLFRSMGTASAHFVPKTHNTHNGKDDELSPFLRTVALYDAGDARYNNSLRYKAWQIMLARGQFEDALAVKIVDRGREVMRNKAVVRELVKAGHIDRASTVDVDNGSDELRREVALHRIRKGQVDGIGDFSGDRVFQRALHQLCLDMIEAGDLSVVARDVLPLLKRMNVRECLWREVQENLELARANRQIEGQFSTDMRASALHGTALAMLIEERGIDGSPFDDIVVKMMNIGKVGEARDVLVTLARRVDGTAKEVAVALAHIAHALMLIGRRDDARGIFHAAIEQKFANVKESVEMKCMIAGLMIESDLIEVAASISMPIDKQAEMGIKSRCVSALIESGRIRESMRLARKYEGKVGGDEMIAKAALAYAKNRDFREALAAPIRDPKLAAQVRRQVAAEMVRCGMCERALGLAERMSDADRWFVRILVADRYLNEGNVGLSEKILEQAFGSESDSDVKIAAASAAIEIGRLGWSMRGFEGVLDLTTSGNGNRLYWLNRILDAIGSAYDRMEYSDSSERSQKYPSQSPKEAVAHETEL